MEKRREVRYHKVVKDEQDPDLQRLLRHGPHRWVGPHPRASEARWSRRARASSRPRRHLWPLLTAVIACAGLATIASAAGSPRVQDALAPMSRTVIGVIDEGRPAPSPSPATPGAAAPAKQLGRSTAPTARPTPTQRPESTTASRSREREGSTPRPTASPSPTWGAGHE